MARKAEQRFYDNIKVKLPKHLWLQRVENAVVEGMPDLHIISRLTGKTVWIELKVTDLPKRKTTALLRSDNKLRPGQIVWLKHHRQFKGTSYIFIRDDQKAIYLIPGEFASLVNDMTQEDAWKYSVADTFEEVITILEG